MNKKKVRELVKDLRNVIADVKELGSDIVNFKNVPVENLEVITEALEKQLPMRAEFLYMVDDKRARFKCKCGNTFVHECPTFPYGVMDYCDNCGQRLDWSEQS